MFRFVTLALFLVVGNAHGQGVEALLDSIADSATVEHARCLYGTTRPDGSFSLSWAVEPHVDSLIGRDQLAVEPCPRIALAFWHNHRPGWIPGNVIGGAVYLPEARSMPERACYLSQQDILSAIRAIAPPLQIVQVKRGIRCWWTKVQIARSVTTNGMALFLLPIEGQR
jgi:hypothetical protein